MYKYIILLVSICFLVSCSYIPPAHNLKLIIDKQSENVAVSTEEKTDMIAKAMSVENPNLEFSRYCKINNNKAYIFITSVSEYCSRDLWGDLKLLQEMEGLEAVTIYLNSPGGEAFQGMSIVDELRIFKKHGIPITVEGRGLIASAAVPIFLIADVRIASKYTVFMIHPAKVWKWGLFSESLSDLQSQAKMIELLNTHYAESVSNRSKLSQKEVLEMMKKDNWFTAQEAVAMGFVDRIE